MAVPSAVGRVAVKHTKQNITNAGPAVRRWLVAALFAGLLCHSCSAQRNYFYRNYDYGSMAVFNPLSFIFNGGYDVCQLQAEPNDIGALPYGKMAHVVFKNLTSPFKSISVYGWGKFIRGEVIPLEWHRGEMQWIPNYQNHLIGGGMFYTEMKEWYQDHGYPSPWLLSTITVMTQHLLNEILESGPNEGWSVDEVSDIYIFDIGGILLFSFDSVNEFFSDKLHLSDWSLQATVTLPYGRVNAGQYFAVKWQLPFSTDYSLFYRYGMGALLGLSKHVNEEDAVSFGVGFKTKHLVDQSLIVRDRTIETSWHTGVFYDRNNSLLASLVLSGVREYFCMADIYPGILRVGDLSPGIWTVIGRDGNVMFGLTTRYLVSIGVEHRVGPPAHF